MTRTEILLSLQDALIGEIYCNIRAIVFDYNEETKSFILKFYLDREPAEDDFENISNVIGEFLSHFKFSEFDNQLWDKQFENDVTSSKLNGLGASALKGFNEKSKQFLVNQNWC